MEDCEISPVDNGETSYSNGALDMIFNPRHHHVRLGLHEVGDNSCPDGAPSFLALSIKFFNLRHEDLRELAADNIMTIFRGGKSVSRVSRYRVFTSGPLVVIKQ